MLNKVYKIYTSLSKHAAISGDWCEINMLIHAIPEALETGQASDPTEGQNTTELVDPVDKVQTEGGEQQTKEEYEEQPAENVPAPGGEQAPEQQPVEGEANLNKEETQDELEQKQDAEQEVKDREMQEEKSPEQVEASGEKPDEQADEKPDEKPEEKQEDENALVPQEIPSATGR